MEDLFRITQPCVEGEGTNSSKKETLQSVLSCKLMNRVCLAILKQGINSKCGNTHLVKAINLYFY